MLIFISLLLLLKAPVLIDEKTLPGQPHQSVRILVASPLLSTALPPERACMRNSSEYKAATMSFAPKAIAVQRQSNSRLLVDSTSIRLANGDCCRESCPLFSALRHRAPSSPICLSEGVKQALRLIASIPLIQRREKYPSRKEKSAFT